MTYIPRTLIADKFETDQRNIEESEISSISGPVIILGEPGIGKSELTTCIEKTTGARRVSAGTFSRSENLAPFAVPDGGCLIVDGLDEVSSTGGESALDIILKKLDRLGRPKFILSCRAADWQGSPDRWKIEQDYGVRPVTLHIEPFSRDQAVRFLERYEIDSGGLVDEITNRGLVELAGNPLTLGLLAELVLEGQGLPDSRTDLIDRASRLLVKEANPAHQGSVAALARIEDLLLSAGAIAAHILISGSVGVSTGRRDGLPAGFVHVSEIADLPDAPLAVAALGTRLFRSEGEGLFFPIHRIIAEYWAAYWLARRLEKGLSERRIFNAIEFGGGVPSALRGLHAWLGHFSPAVADRCIRTDPYGVLRYGESDKLPTARARLLLSSLAALAKEDPYFRSEDWGVRAVSGLARPELKGEIIAVVRSPDRHFHLSSLLLEALAGSTLALDIAPVLLDLVNDTRAPYAERHHAAEALIASKSNLDWAQIVERLVSEGGEGNSRLALETIAQLKGEGFTSRQIANALVAHEGLTNKNGNGRVGGLDYLLVRRLTPAQCAGVLDELAQIIGAVAEGPYWSPNHRITSTVLSLAATALDEQIAPERFWTWHRYVDSRTSYSKEVREQIAGRLRADPEYRRAIQRVALNDKSIESGPWMAIVHELPQANDGLWISQDDATYFLEEISAKSSLTDDDVMLWRDLVRSQGRPDNFGEGIQQVIADSTARHGRLAQTWEELRQPPKRDYEKENQKRQDRYRRQQEAKFAVHRRSFAKVVDKVRSGKELGALHSLALAYLNRYSELKSEAEPIDRLREWVGDDIAAAATDGFIACLSEPDLPTLAQVVDIRKEGKHWTVEPILMCGAAELVRRGQGLAGISEEVATAILAVWWDMPEFNASKLGSDLEAQLEARVFKSDAAMESFVCAVIEPQIAEGKDHVSNLYRLSREDRFKHLAERLALKWLRAYPDARVPIQVELLQIALRSGTRPELIELAVERLNATKPIAPDSQRTWISAAFLLELPNAASDVKSCAERDPEIFWSIVSLSRADEQRHLSLSIQQLEFMIATFSSFWPQVEMKSGWQGDNEPWNATNFLRSCINKIGADPTAAASEALDRLAVDPSCANYVDQIMHVRAQQRRLRRDKDYVAPSLEEVKRALSDDVPGTIDDMRALVLDRLDVVQKYLRDADTAGWEAFWSDQGPKVENTCRDRLLDALRPRMPQSVDLVPECLMPELNRCDVLALHQGKGLPIEIKGQWHKNVWDASETQLDDQYGRDWRANGRGIYLVLWFGITENKNLTRHPDGLAPPSSPQQLRDMLVQRLDEPGRRLIDIFVLDISRPPPKSRAVERIRRAAPA